MKCYSRTYFKNEIDSICIGIMAYYIIYNDCSKIIRKIDNTKYSNEMMTIGRIRAFMQNIHIPYKKKERI